MLLHDALLDYALLHFDVLVHGELVNRMEGAGRSGVRGGEPLTLHLRTLKRFVQPLHRKRALAEIIHGGGLACRPSHATLASTDCSSDRRESARGGTRYRYRRIDNCAPLPPPLWCILLIDLLV